MKNVLPIALISFVLASSVSAQKNFWHQTNGPEGGTLREMTIDSSGNVFVWTGGSGVYHSSNFGTTWQLMNKGLPSLNMKRGASGPPSSGYLYASNSKNEVFRLNEKASGAQWEDISANKDTNITLYDILADPNGEVYLASYHGVQRSDDNGLTWVQKNSNLRDSIKPKLFDSSVIFLSIDGNGNLFAALHYGGIFRSTNKGDTWMKLPSRDPDGYAISALLAASNGNIVIGNYGVAGIGGRIYVSRDTGKTWDTVYTRPVGTPERKDNIDKIIRVPGSNILYANAHGITLRSVDNGLTWSVMDSDKRGDEPFSMGIFGNNVFQMSEPDGIFLSNDNGKTWTAKNKGFYAQLMWDIAINSKQELFGITEYGLHRSTNNGDTWDQAPEYGETYYPSIYIDKKDSLFIGTSFGLFRSADNGQTLKHIFFSDTTLAYNIIIQIGADATGKLYCSSSIDSIGFRYSTDEGDHWVKVTGLPEQNTSIYAFAFASKDTILLASNVSSYYRSTDNGATWNLLSGNNHGTYQLLIHPDGSYLARVKNGGNAGVFRSTDGAQNWTKIFPPVDFPAFNTYYSMMVDHNGKIVICTDSGIYRSSDNSVFTQWFNVSAGITAYDFPNHYISASAVVENPVTQVFYAASRGLSVFKSIPDFDTSRVGVFSGNPPIPSLSIKARPNPFAASTNIVFTLDKATEVTLEAYDVLGRLVGTLFSGPAEQGEHFAMFDGSGLPSGNFLIVLRTGGKTYSSWVTLTR